MCGISYEKLQEYNSAAQHFEKAANDLSKLSKNGERKEEAKQSMIMFQKASEMYRFNEQPDKGATLLVKAADVMQTIDIAGSVKLVSDAVGVFEDEKRTIFGKRHIHSMCCISFESFSIR